MQDDDSLLTGIDNEEIVSTYFQRLFSNILDFAIELAAAICIYLIVPVEFILWINSMSFAKYIFFFLLMIVYRLIFLLSFGKTIGMMTFRLKYLNSNLQPLTSKEKLFAVFATQTSSIRLYKAG